MVWSDVGQILTPAATESSKIYSLDRQQPQRDLALLVSPACPFDWADDTELLETRPVFVSFEIVANLLREIKGSSVQAPSISSLVLRWNLSWPWLFLKLDVISFSLSWVIKHFYVCMIRFVHQAGVAFWTFNSSVHLTRNETAYLNLQVQTTL